MPWVEDGNSRRVLVLRLISFARGAGLLLLSSTFIPSSALVILLVPLVPLSASFCLCKGYNFLR